jgi:hypothetical protein
MSFRLNLTNIYSSKHPILTNILLIKFIKNKILNIMVTYYLYCIFLVWELDLLSEPFPCEVMFHDDILYRALSYIQITKRMTRVFVSIRYIINTNLLILLPFVIYDLKYGWHTLYSDWEKITFRHMSFIFDK